MRKNDNLVLLTPVLIAELIGQLILGYCSTTILNLFKLCQSRFWEYVACCYPSTTYVVFEHKYNLRCNKYHLFNPQCLQD